MQNSKDQTREPQLTDSDLLRQLRNGDLNAYTELWRRHVRAALRLGERIAPSHAEDLVSDSFTVVFDQIVNAGNGPETSFRAYLFTTMRNTATRWGAKDRIVDSYVDADQIEMEDGLKAVSDREESAQLLAAFQDLPERWQRILWLAEVEDVGRAQIAADLKIKPNAVSALLRRAKSGMRLSWMKQAVPLDLRDDSTHVAAQLPELFVRSKSDLLRPALREHLAECGRCAEVNAHLRSIQRRARNGTLGSAGLAALGVVLPSISNAPLATAAVAAGIAWVSTIAAGVSLAVFGGFTLGDPSSPRAEEAVVSNSVDSTPVASEQSNTPPSAQLNTLPTEVPLPTEPGESLAPVPGRDNLDTTIPVTSFQRDVAPNDFYVAPARPTPVDPMAVPRPAPDPDDTQQPTPPNDPVPIPTTPGAGVGEPELTAGITSPLITSGYMAPVLEGTTRADAEVAIEFERRPDDFSTHAYGEMFVVQADSTGRWSLDLRAIIPDSPGVFDYQAWAILDDDVSEATAGTFTTFAPVMTGFESVAVGEFLPADEAATTGIVFGVQGSAGGSVCVAEVTTAQEIRFDLDESGTTFKRLRFLSSGTYWMSFRACDREYRGPAKDVFVDVEGSIFGPFGPGLEGEPEFAGPGFGLGDPEPGELKFELVEP